MPQDAGEATEDAIAIAEGSHDGNAIVDGEASPTALTYLDVAHSPAFLKTKKDSTKKLF